MNEPKVNVAIVAANRKPISMIGSSLGTQFFQAEARASIPEFEKLKLTVEQNNNVDFCLNRTPRRYRMTGHDILGANVVEDAIGTTKVVLNQGLDSQVSIPVVAGMERIGIVTEDALGKALRVKPGEPNNYIFSDAKKLAMQLNQYNLDEKARLTKMVEVLTKCISQLDSAIAENNKKADQYQNEILQSTPETLPNAEIVVNVGGDQITVKD